MWLESLQTRSWSPRALEEARADAEADEEATVHRAAWETRRSSDPALREKYEYEHVRLRLKSAGGKDLRPLLTLGRGGGEGLWFCVRFE